MFSKWLPWKMIISSAAKKRGFLDPIDIASKLQRFAQPSQVAAPTELLRSGFVLHARGLVNSQAIQHNLDWIWPYWVERQFDPKDDSFIPRAFSITHINLTHRNWVALGIPDCGLYPIVDPCGLVTPHFDGFSIDTWVIDASGEALIPSRISGSLQELNLKGKPSVISESRINGKSIVARVSVEGSVAHPVCRIQIEAQTHFKEGFLVVVLRPYNPEGISFVHDIDLLEDAPGWKVNHKFPVYFSEAPEKHAFSYYRRGDVFSQLPANDAQKKVQCRVGLATAAAQFELKNDLSRRIAIEIPLETTSVLGKTISLLTGTDKTQQEAEGAHKDEASDAWAASIKGTCQIRVPDERFQFLYDAAVRTLILHTPGEVYPGPYTYRRFWFRDAAFILYALLSVGLKERVKRAIDLFPSRQSAGGYFLSQEGEWDSNGEALWIMEKYHRMTREAMPLAWKKAIDKGGRWIMRKRLRSVKRVAHEGLLPAGFSAEHLGPNDFYYWDDFFGVAGLRAAGFLEKIFARGNRPRYFDREAADLMRSIEASLVHVKERMGKDILPASPYRRMDAGAIGSIVADYPLRLLPAHDKRIKNTLDFLLEHCMVNGGFFQDMTHSGVNPYLTLHMAQVLLRGGDPRFFDLMSAVAHIATSVGQWPEAIHPKTGGGCMGDGQHVWAAAEWIMMLRNCFVREEGDKLILFSGLPRAWLVQGAKFSIGPAVTEFGTITLHAEVKDETLFCRWEASWFEAAPKLEIALCEGPTEAIKEGQHTAQVFLRK